MIQGDVALVEDFLLLFHPHRLRLGLVLLEDIMSQVRRLCGLAFLRVEFLQT